jgi:TPR repeat protein
MNPVDSPWLAAHGRLWYDDKWYRLSWLVWPQALALAAVLWFWAMPSSTGKHAPWAKAVDTEARANDLTALRDAAKSSQSSMDTLERDAQGGEMTAQFYMGSLYDPDLAISTIVKPDAVKAVGWYTRAAGQGEDASLGNLALLYFNGIYVRRDWTRACEYASKLVATSFANALAVKGDCYGRGLGGMQVDLVQAATAYEQAYTGGNARAGASLGYFYEHGIGGRGKSAETALKYYREAADKNEPLGFHNLGYAYAAGLFGLQRDGGEAARLIMGALEAKYDITVSLLTSHPEYWSSDFWQNLQRRLAEKGLYNGAIDGRANSATLEAVKRLGKA